MAESPELPDVNDREYSPAIRRLAERYGMTPEAIEQIVTGANAVAPGPTVTTHAPSAVVDRAPAQHSAPLADAPDNRKAAVPPSRTPSGPGLPIAIAIVVLIGLGVALSFKQGCYRQRGSDEALRPNVSDTLQSQQIDAAKQASEPPVQPTPVTPPQVPPEALNTPRETPPGTTGPPPPSDNQAQTAKSAPRSTGTRPAKPVLSTSSHLQAEEQLAELRANGNMRARIVARGTGAKRTYKVYSR